MREKTDNMGLNAGWWVEGHGSIWDLSYNCFNFLSEETTKIISEE